MLTKEAGGLEFTIVFRFLPLNFIFFVNRSSGTPFLPKKICLHHQQNYPRLIYSFFRLTRLNPREVLLPLFWFCMLRRNIPEHQAK